VIEVVQEPLGVGRDLEEPLGDPPLLHGRPAPLARTSDHLLVGQHRLARRAPVDGGLLPLHQAGFEQLKEDPLRPAIVIRIGGVDRVGPIEHAPDPSELSCEVRDIPRDQVHGMDVDLEREVLGMDPEGVEPDGLEDGPPPQPMVAAMHIRTGEGIDVPHMEALGGGIGEHHQLIEGIADGTQLILRELVRTLRFPDLLPLLLDLGR
jgi:hypothetical protein